MIIRPGFYRIPDDEYHAGPGLSKSDLFLLLRSPAHYKAKEERKETPALILGSAIHVAVFQPKEFERRYVVKPEGMSFVTKEGKAWRSEQEGSIILSFEDYKTCEGIKKAVRSHPIAADLLSDGEPEVTGYWDDPEAPEILCKLRMDWVNKAKRIIVDLKSCMDAREHIFKRDAYNLRYHMQSSWYCYGVTQITRIEHRDFYFIAVEKDPPYGVAVYKASDDMTTEGLKDCAKALGIYKRCMEEGRWPCYPEEIVELGLPGWVTRKEPNFIIE
uniref:Putative exodeoxyribonuclease 8 PDDEXK-like domain-containing protein n=1 Tax=viral metagenome TaxID=1070528 RepID=A0A6H2A544_9ZZZZ